MSSRATQPHAYWRSRVLACLALLPLLIGAVLVLAGFNIERSWSPEAQAAGAGGAPEGAAAAGSAGPAARAVSEAGAQAGLLKTGAGQLAAGAGELNEGAESLGGGVREAQSGAGELAEGMRQLQAGTGQLGRGAEELADAVGGAVDQVLGLRAVQGQLLSAADELDGELRGSPDPQAAKLREALAGFRSQVAAVDISKDIAPQLTRLKDGSRELATQLASPGAEYHDGVYQATKGAQALKEGLDQLAGGTDKAQDGVRRLDEGAKKLDQMAGQNRDKIGAVQRALSGAGSLVTAEPVSGAETTGPGAASAGITPLLGVLLAGLGVLGGMAGALLGAVTGPGRRVEGWLIGGGTAVVAAVLYWVIAAPGWVASLSGTLAVLLGAAASAALTLLVAAAWRGQWGRVVAVVLGLVQVAVVGAAWRWAATGQPPVVIEAVSGLFPLHWAAVALAGTNSTGGVAAGWLGCGLLAAVAALGMIDHKLRFKNSLGESSEMDLSALDG